MLLLEAQSFLLNNLPNYRPSSWKLRGLVRFLTDYCTC